MLDRLVHWVKAASPISVTLAGRLTESSPPQPSNALLSIASTSVLMVMCPAQQAVVGLVLVTQLAVVVIGVGDAVGDAVGTVVSFSGVIQSVSNLNSRRKRRGHSQCVPVVTKPHENRASEYTLAAKLTGTYSMAVVPVLQGGFPLTLSPNAEPPIKVRLAGSTMLLRLLHEEKV
jgi:hypothetical protein